MTFCGGKIAEGGLETGGRGVEMVERSESFPPFPFRDFRRDFMEKGNTEMISHVDRLIDK